MLEQPGAMKKHGEMRQTEFVLSQAEQRLEGEPVLTIFKSAGQNFLVVCDCKAASAEPLSKRNKGVVMLYRVYKVLGLLSSRCCEGSNICC